MAESSTLELPMTLDIKEVTKQDPADGLDTVSTHATLSNSFSGSGRSDSNAFSGSDKDDAPSGDELVCVPCPEMEKPEEGAAEATKDAKKLGGRRNRRGARPWGANAALYAKALYKRRFCAHFPNVEACRRGGQCAFAHSRAEFRGSLLPADEEHEGAHSDDFYMNRYKTLWCPIGVQHDWQKCVYAHNYLDIRRNPAIGYGPRQCPYWDKSNSKSAYDERCPNGVRCPYAHGAKEQLYHPAHFKAVVCWDMMSAEGCPRSHLCAFYHSKEECRVEITKEMEFDYTQRLEGKLVKLLQKDFNTPPPIGADLDASKPAPMSQRKAPALPAPAPAPAMPPAMPRAPPQPETPHAQVPVMVMMMPTGMPQGAMVPQGMPGMPMPMPLAIHPQMIANAGPDGQRFFRMVPTMQPMDGSVTQEQMGPQVMQLAHVPHNAEHPAGAYPQQGPAFVESPVHVMQQQQHGAGQSATFQQMCSPSMQSSDAYAQYCKDIMNADGDEYDFDWPRRGGFAAPAR
jgi:hypothetical protein